MSLFKIAWRSIRQRMMPSLLTALSMALGVMLVVAVLAIHGVVSESFRNNSSLGYNMIVGAEGGKLQLTLNTVYYLSTPIENIPYDYYLEFTGQEQRDQAYEHSIQRHVDRAGWETMQLAQAVSPLGVGPAGVLPFAAVQPSLGQASAATGNLSELFQRPVAAWQQGRHGQYGQFIELAIPMCLGDYVQQFRVVGTSPAMFDKLTFGPENDRKFEFQAGRNFKTWSREHGYFEAVVGSAVARQLDIGLGQTINPSHGDPEQGGSAHAQQFHVVGVLAPSGTPHDRAVFINIEGFYLMEDHYKPVDDDGSLVATGVEEPGDPTQPLPVEQREVTAILIRTINPLVSIGIENAVNEGGRAQAVLPVLEIYSLFEIIVQPVKNVLLVLTAMICFVSGVSILVSIYNSMSERRSEIAVMRSLGAGRGAVMTIILLESIMLALGGGGFGWLAGHGLIWLASPQIEAQTGVTIGFFDIAPGPNVLELFGMEPTIEWLQLSPELMIVPGLILLAVLVGFVPAISAYRTDVARYLTK